MSYVEMQWWKRFIDDQDKCISEEFADAAYSWPITCLKTISVNPQHPVEDIGGGGSALGPMRWRETERVPVTTTQMKKKQTTSSHDKSCSGRQQECEAFNSSECIGHMILHQSNKMHDQYQIGKAVAFTNGNIKILPYVGKQNSVWKPVEKKRLVLIKQNDIRFIFQLTAKLHLPSFVKNYRIVCNQSRN